jgi:dolichol-phosphate mannosyltransferase
VVDDQSPDGTGAAADALAREFPERVEVLHRTGKRGLGLSYVDGFQLAVKRDVDLICQMDADFSHDPKYLPALAASAVDCDLVVGSRYLNGISVVNWPLRRLILSTFANHYIRAVTGLAVSDCTGGFRCWRRDALARIPLGRIVSDGYAFMVEMLFEAARQRCRIGEVPIVFVERRMGTSKLSGGVLLESIVMRAGCGIPRCLIAKSSSWSRRRIRGSPGTRSARSWSRSRAAWPHAATRSTW